MVDIYVSTTGSDSNVGTRIDKPFLTPGKADSVASPGDTIRVLPGSFTFGSTVNTTASGTVTQPITWLGVGALFAGTMNNSELWVAQGNFVTIFGFDLSGVQVKIGLSLWGHHGRVLFNKAHDCGTSLVTGSPGAGFFDYTGITNIGHNEFGYNTALNCGINPTQEYHGMYMNTAGSLVHDNISSNNGGWGILSNGSNQGDASNMFFSHNLVFQNSYGGFKNENGSDANLYANNITYKNGRGAITGNGFTEQSSGLNHKYYNNCSHLQAGVDFFNVNGVQVGTILADPQFVNYQDNGTGDYHLKSTSPCIDTGYVAGWLSALDYDGKRRPSGAGFDVGPYELTQTAYHG